jgi:splicing factor 3A subunit 3
MESLIEQQRRTHEEIERIEKAIVAELSTKTKTVRFFRKNNTEKHKGRLIKDHIVHDYLVRIQSNAQELLQDYRNEDARLEELADLGGTIPDAMEEFYRRYRKISSAHRKNPGLVAETMEMEFVQDEMAKRGYYEELLEPKFSGEEGFGKYLDLNHHYDRYLNLKGVLDQKMSYMSYLADFDKFELIPRETRSRSDYVN